jgi:hypothetical protein
MTMSDVVATWRRLRPAAKLAVALLAAYSLVHFAYSGAWGPLRHHALVQTSMEGRPLQQYLREGGPVGPNNFRQYGPTFLLGMHPLFLCCAGPEPGNLNLDTVPPEPGTIRLSRAMYLVDIVCLALGCWFIVASVRILLAQSTRLRAPALFPYAAAAIVFLWFNYSPLYEVLEVKSVEIWEVFLISAAMYAQLTRRPFWTGFCIAAAALMKWLPAFFFLPLLLRDRRAFTYACLSAVFILGISHVVYGPELGLRYPLLPVKAAQGHTIGFTGIANMSAKGLFAKALGTLYPPSVGNFEDGDPRSGYYVAITPARANVANRFGNLVTVIGVAFTIWALLGRTRRERTIENDAWAWALCGAVMFVVSPLLAYEYSLLVLPAFCIATVLVLAAPASRSRAAAAVLLGVALFLVGNIIPRQIVQRAIPMELLVRWSGYSHLKLTEAYYYFGFPMFGVVLLVVVLWLTRPDASEAPRMASVV